MLFAYVAAAVVCTLRYALVPRLNLALMIVSPKLFTIKAKSAERSIILIKKTNNVDETLAS